MTLVQHTTETGVQWVNASGLEVSEIGSQVDQVARQLASWVDDTQGRRRPHLFDRTSYATPRNPFQAMKVARGAVENDDIVSSVADVSEGLAHQGCKWESEHPDDADAFNQMSRDLDLDSFVRVWHREEFTYSQVVVGMWWGYSKYKVRGKGTAGNKRRKEYDIACPQALTVLDPLRVVPLPPGPFGQDRLAWHASRSEMAGYLEMLVGEEAMDPVMGSFFAGPVTGLSRAHKAELTAWGIDPNRLILLNEKAVFRHTLTKATYEPFTQLRMRSVFGLLDLKQQVMEADRVSLVGAANYILLVKKGTKDDPASQEELDNLNANMKTLAKLPVIVGDHRLEIEIITPEQQYVLDPNKWDVIDSRVLSRVMGTLAAGAQIKDRSSGSINPGTAVGRGLENRRHMMKRALEKHIARAVVDHPYNAGKFEDEPNLAFTPRRIQVVSDVEFAQQVMALRTQKELSRESTLEHFGFDQATEAQRREYEEEEFDDIFQTQVPFSAGGAPPAAGQQPEDPTVSGARGGRPRGGGDTAQNPTKQTRRQDKGNGARSEGQ